ncbi:MAG: hypothetical protein ABJB86_10710 [Bacteroidota bacterium]
MKKTTTAFVLTAMDTLGCPKPFRDTVFVFVLPQIELSEGNDTSMVITQPLQLHAVPADSTTLNDSWVPGTWLKNAAINNPGSHYFFIIC